MGIPVISQSSFEDSLHFVRGREIFIRLSLLTLMGVSCVLVLRPFLNLILCGIVISIGMYPVHRMLARQLHGRTKLSAALCSALLLLVMIVPCVLLAGTLVDGIQSVAHQVQAGHLDLPAPPASLDTIPVVGPRIKDFWILCNTNLSEALKRFGPQIHDSIPAMLAASARAGGAMVQLLIAIILAGFLLATSETSGRFASKLFARIFGDQGEEFKELVGSTIRTVTNGVLGVAVLQTLCATLGFWVAGLPGTGLWALVFLVAAILQAGVLVLLPAVIFGFATFSTTKAVIFLVWCIIVGVMDNVLKPILLGRGAKVPMLVIFLGVLGGFVALNSIIGLFVGAIVVSVAYKLFMAWLDQKVPDAAASEEVHSAR